MTASTWMFLCAIPVWFAAGYYFGKARAYRDIADEYAIPVFNGPIRDRVRWHIREAVLRASGRIGP